MEDILQFIAENVQYAHWYIFGLLLLAGLNIPVSEDGMLFISGVLASNHPEYSTQLFIGVFLGAYFSDLICFTLGWKLGPKLFEIKFFENMVPPERIQKIHAYYEQYGVITLILGRFIPFGVRNGLFLSAGLGKMDPVKFALSDLLACTISTVTFFTLYYNYGNAVVETIKSGNKLIFALALILVIVYFVKKKNNAAEDEGPQDE